MKRFLIALLILSVLTFAACTDDDVTETTTADRENLPPLEENEDPDDPVGGEADGDQSPDENSGGDAVGDGENEEETTKGSESSNNNVELPKVPLP